MADPGGVYPPPRALVWFASICAAMNYSLVSYPDPLRHRRYARTLCLSTRSGYETRYQPACLTIEAQATNALERTPFDTCHHI